MEVRTAAVDIVPHPAGSAPVVVLSRPPGSRNLPVAVHVSRPSSPQERLQRTGATTPSRRGGGRRQIAGVLQFLPSGSGTPRIGAGHRSLESGCRTLASASHPAGSELAVGRSTSDVSSCFLGFNLEFASWFFCCTDLWFLNDCSSLGRTGGRIHCALPDDCS